MTHPTQSTTSSNQDQQFASSSLEEQVIQLKRLLVTFKKQYEKNVETLQMQLQEEIKQKQAVQKELAAVQLRANEAQKHHEEEQAALIKQQIALKELLKENQSEMKRYSPSSNHGSVSSQNALTASQQRIEQLEKLIPYFKERAHEANQETEQLKEELEGAHKKINFLEGLQQASLESSQEKELLNPYLQELQQSRLLITQKDHELKQNQQTIETLRIQLEQLKKIEEQQDVIQEKYELLREEWVQLKSQLEESEEVRLQLKNQTQQLQDLLEEQGAQLAVKNVQFDNLLQEYEQLQTDRQELSCLLEESDTRLKVAQQHLAKKVKESSILAERAEELQQVLNEQQNALEAAKVQINHLQTNIDLYQKQEKRLQEQLHEALKSTESQVNKWEEKYFKMYDKWQEAETRVKELKKFEEKHLHMQNLLANLGNFMGSSSFNGSLPPHSFVETVDKQSRSQVSTEFIEPEEEIKGEERYDVFGMRHPPHDKFKPHSLS